MKFDICGMEKLSLVDYDQKVSCTLFTNGCNFRCPFCHNGTLCTDNLEKLDFDDILEYLKSRKNIIDAVVFTGGEPTLYPDLKKRITQVKELGFLVKLDTNGTNPIIVRDLIENKLIDYCAMDIKNSELKYSLTTNNYFLDLDKIKSTINILINSGIDYEFRTTLIKEFHEEKDIIEMCNLIKGTKKYYLQKFVERDECLQHGLNPIDQDTAKHFCDIAKSILENCELRGY